MRIDSLPMPYGKFRPIVADIRANNTDAQFLDQGAESSVWRVNVDGGDYVVKIANDLSIRGRRRNTFRATEEKIKTGLRGLGIPGLEQVQAGSPEDAAVVFDYVDALNVSKMTDEDITAITKQHVTALGRTIFAATRVGIRFDWMNEHGSNAFFDTEAGFTLTDYWLSNESIDFEVNKCAVIRSLGAVGLRIQENFEVTI